MIRFKIGVRSDPLKLKEYSLELDWAIFNSCDDLFTFHIPDLFSFSRKQNIIIEYFLALKRG